MEERAPPAPRATPVPLARRVLRPDRDGEPVHLRLRAAELAQKQLKRKVFLADAVDDDRGARDVSNDDHDLLQARDPRLEDALEGSNNDVVLGPFYVRDEEDIKALRRDIGIEDRHFARREAVRNARAWMKNARDSKLERKRDDSQVMVKRQTVEQNRCYVGNDQLSCYPTSGMRINQGQWGKLIWNHNYPEFTNHNGLVDIYLFHQDSDRLLTSWTGVSNDQGRLSFQPQDFWWEGREPADNFNGTDIAWPFYFVITYNGAGLSGTTHRLATWYAVQTALPEDIASSRSSASLASAATTSFIFPETTDRLASETSSFAASLTSELVSDLNSEGLTGTETLQTSATTTLSNGDIITASATAQANGKLPPPGGDHNGLPAYAIALIAVFGLIALTAIIVGMYFAMAAVRRRQGRDRRIAEVFSDSTRSGSNAPMIGSHGSEPDMTIATTTAHDGADEGPQTREIWSEPSSPGVAGFGAMGSGIAAGFAAAASRARSKRRPLSMPSSLPRTDEYGEQPEMQQAPGEPAQEPFSSNDASRLAAAFRAVLRRPHFTSLGSGKSTMGTSSALLPSGTTSRPLSSGGGNDSGGEAAERDRGGARITTDVAQDSGGGRSRNSPTEAAATELLREELDAEGREMRRVDEQRRPEVHDSREHLPPPTQ